VGGFSLARKKIRLPPLPRRQFFQGTVALFTSPVRQVMALSPFLAAIGTMVLVPGTCDSSDLQWRNYPPFPPGDLSLSLGPLFPSRVCVFPFLRGHQSHLRSATPPRPKVSFFTPQTPLALADTVFFLSLLYFPIVRKTCLSCPFHAAVRKCSMAARIPHLLPQELVSLSPNFLTLIPLLAPFSFSCDRP